MTFPGWEDPCFWLSQHQRELLAPFVRDQRVLDLGAADLTGSDLMLELGARDVLAVDKHPMPTPSSSAIETRVTQFHQLEENRPVVLASWIVNHPVNIEHLLETAETVVSISKNTDGTACGYKGMWAHLCRREILLYLPERRSTLTVYGRAQVTRPLTGEELAALDQNHMYEFDEAEAAAMSSPQTVESFAPGW